MDKLPSPFRPSKEAIETSEMLEYIPRIKREIRNRDAMIEFLKEDNARLARSNDSYYRMICRTLGLSGS